MTRPPWEEEDDEDAAPEGYQMRAADADAFDLDELEHDVRRMLEADDNDEEC